MRKILYLAMTLAITPLITPSTTLAAPTCTVGEIKWFAMNRIPHKSFLQANGDLYAIKVKERDLSALNDVIKNRYGGDGVKTIRVPDLRKYTLIGRGQAPGMNNYVVGKKYGKVSMTLTDKELPKHSHQYSPAQVNVEKKGVKMSGSADIVVALKSTAEGEKTQPTGNGEAFTQLQPSLVLMPTICWNGFMPRRF